MMKPAAIRSRASIFGSIQPTSRISIGRFGASRHSSELTVNQAGDMRQRDISDAAVEYVHEGRDRDCAGYRPWIVLRMPIKRLGTFALRPGRITLSGHFTHTFGSTDIPGVNRAKSWLRSSAMVTVTR